MNISLPTQQEVRFGENKLDLPRQLPKPQLVRFRHSKLDLPSLKDGIYLNIVIYDIINLTNPDTAWTQEVRFGYSTDSRQFV